MSRVGSGSVEFADQFKDASSKHSRADGHETNHQFQTRDVGDGLGKKLFECPCAPPHICGALEASLVASSPLADAHIFRTASSVHHFAWATTGKTHELAEFIGDQSPRCDLCFRHADLSEGSLPDLTEPRHRRLHVVRPQWIVRANDDVKPQVFPRNEQHQPAATAPSHDVDATFVACVMVDDRS